MLIQSVNALLVLRFVKIREQVFSYLRGFSLLLCYKNTHYNNMNNLIIKNT